MVGRDGITAFGLELDLLRACMESYQRGPEARFERPADST
jgi:hypothetical protein